MKTNNQSYHSILSTFICSLIIMMAASLNASLFIQTVYAKSISISGSNFFTTYINKNKAKTRAAAVKQAAVAAGSWHSVLLKADGTVWSWGYNYDGELGNGTADNSTTPVQVAGLTGISAVDAAANGYHTAALKNDGTVWTWGYNGYGQLGNGTAENSTNPVQVEGLTGVSAVAAGGWHTAALKTDGTVWAWGYNSYGQLGDGTTIDSYLPVKVTGLTGVSAIAVSGSHTAALKTDGTVWTWGYNGDGQLGNGTTVDSTTPIQVAGLTGVSAIAAGGWHTAALKTDGTVWAWGYNGDGQLGSGNTVDSTTPIQVAGLTGVSAIATGDSHTLAVKTDGTVWAWGYNDNGQLGNGTVIESSTPVQVVKLADFSAIAAGGSHTIAIKTDGTVWAWGYNNYGQLGDGTTADSTTPVEVNVNNSAFESSVITGQAESITSNSSVLNGIVNADEEITAIYFEYGTTTNYGTKIEVSKISVINNSALVAVNITGLVANTTYHFRLAAQTSTGITNGSDQSFTTKDGGNSVKMAVAAGDQHTVLLKSDGTVWTWGNNYWGQLGNGTKIDSSTPVQVIGLTDVAAIAADGLNTAALKTDGTVWTWGTNSSGQLGNGTKIDSSIPVQVIGLTDVDAIVVSYSYVVALRTDGTVWAWGSNGYGQLGSGNTVDSTTPIQVAGLTGVSAIATGDSHTLAVKTDGTVWAWGNNNYGKLGNGTKTDSTTPVQVNGLTGVSAIAAGVCHTVALKTDGTVWAWGAMFVGQLGNGTEENIGISTPIQVNDITSVSAIVAGDYHTLALKTDGTIWAWGQNTDGQLGNGIITRCNSTPVRVTGLTDISAIATNWHTVALKPDGTVWVWGNNSYGQLGDGTTNPRRSTPVQVNGLTGVSAIASGEYHTVALKTDGTVWAWGSNYHGLLGDGTINPGRSTPVQVTGLTDVAAIAASRLHTIALKNDATVWAWGDNQFGGFGNGTYQSSNTPVHVTGLTGVSAIAAGYYYTLALKTDGTVWAWGSNYSGQLGNGTTDKSNTPVQVVNLINISTVTAGYEHTIALKTDGTVWAWGSNQYGQLGNSMYIDNSTPVQVKGLTGISAIAAGSYHTLALKTDGTVWAWGYNYSGQLGNGTYQSSSTPVQVTGLTGGIANIAAGYDSTIVLKTDGTIWAWGDNRFGQLGNGTYKNSSIPIQVSDLKNVSAIAAGILYTVALKTDGTVWAWGDNSDGQLGDGRLLYSTTPIQVSLETQPLEPTAATKSAESITSDSAILKGTVNPNGTSAICSFEYGTTTDYGYSTANQSVGSGTDTVTHSATVTGLNPNTTYHYRIAATNISGTTYGSGQTFKTIGNSTTPDNKVLTDQSPPFTISYGEYMKVFGSAGINTINVESGARVECINFVGQNVVNIEDAASAFKVLRSGATVYLKSSSNTQIKIPATLTPQTLRFSDGSSNLIISSNKVMIGNQVVTLTEAQLATPANSGDTSTGIF
ncbi:MAG: hypothetical protein AB7U45_10985 [Desulfamplus sp.]